MKTFAAVILCIGALASIHEPVQSASILPDCRSYFRLLYPNLFAHCDCEYSSDWSEWEDEPGSVHSVPASECPSAQAYRETRTQEALGEGCNPRIETRRVCKYYYIHFKVSQFVHIIIFYSTVTQACLIQQIA